jgi:glycerate kinase
MKLGLRTPSLKKSIKARTTSKLKRKVKSAINPLYGKKGTGLIFEPKKAIYNKVYHKTSFSIWDLIKKITK